ncbi:MAG: helix-turn-helix domain-containing protein [Nitrososphaerales archaeon]
MRKVTIIKHLGKDELEERFKKEKNPRVKERLLAILHLYDEKKISETASIIRRSVSSVKRWLWSWNEEAYDGLMPEFTGGPKPRMPYSEWDRILEEIENKGMTLKDVKVYVKTTRGIEYSYDAVWKVLRKKMKVRYGKPYIKNSKRPDDAEAVLKKGSMKQYQSIRNR